VWYLLDELLQSIYEQISPKLRILSEETTSVAPEQRSDVDNPCSVSQNEYNHGKEQVTVII
jgi:hypothetical protein